MEPWSWGRGQPRRMRRVLECASPAIVQKGRGINPAIVNVVSMLNIISFSHVEETYSRQLRS